MVEVANASEAIGVYFGIFEGIVGAVFGPRAAFLDLRELYEAPVDDGAVSYAEVVANGRRDIDAGGFVLGVFWLLVAKDVCVVGGIKGTAVFPLGKAVFFGLGRDDLNPAPFADGLAGFWGVSLEPRDHAGGFRFVIGVVQAVVVGEGNIEGVLLWSEIFRQIPTASALFGVIEAPVVLHPLLIP